MLRVNIVVGQGDLGWICGRLAQELVVRLPRYGVHAEINEPTMRDLEYQQVVYGPPSCHPAVGLFTHGQFRPAHFGQFYDGQIVMNPAMRQYLLDAGCKNPTLVELPVDDRFRRQEPLVFGVCGRVYPDKRKGEHLVEAMVKAGYQVLAWGYGWPCRILSSNLHDLPLFYRSIDYYVDTSSDEGGCVPALEAAAMGIPVISHTLGVDRPVIPYETHDWDSLSKVLHALTHSRTYDDWAREHAEYFKQVAELVAA